MANNSEVVSQKGGCVSMPYNIHVCFPHFCNVLIPQPYVINVSDGRVVWDSTPLLHRYIWADKNSLTINIRAAAIPRILFPMDTPLPQELDLQPLSNETKAYRQDVPVQISKEITGIIADTEQPQVISHILSGRSRNPVKIKQGFDTQVLIEMEATPGKSTNDLKDHCSDKGSCGIEKEECHKREHPTRPDETGASPGVLRNKRHPWTENRRQFLKSTTIP